MYDCFCSTFDEKKTLNKMKTYCIYLRNNSYFRTSYKVHNNRDMIWLIAAFDEWQWFAVFHWTGYLNNLDRNCVGYFRTQSLT